MLLEASLPGLPEELLVRGSSREHSRMHRLAPATPTEVASLILIAVLVKFPVSCQEAGVQNCGIVKE